VTTSGPEAILATLMQHGVDFVVIGGLAAIAHGSRRMTRRIDVVPKPADDNLARLEAALGELGAVQLLANADERPIEAAEIAVAALGPALRTRSPAGRLDIVGAPAGAAPYARLRERSIAAKIGGAEVRIAGLDDLIAMKRASGRPRDLEDIADLAAGDPDL
jgi:Nucleotidyl transferase AbiEii toxin, Type IV TA system